MFSEFFAIFVQYEVHNILKPRLEEGVTVRVHYGLILVLIFGSLSVSTSAGQELELSRKVIEIEGHPSQGDRWTRL